MKCHFFDSGRSGSNLGDFQNRYWEVLSRWCDYRSLHKAHPISPILTSLFTCLTDKAVKEEKIKLPSKHEISQFTFPALIKPKISNNRKLAGKGNTVFLLLSFEMSFLVLFCFVFLLQ